MQEKALRINAVQREKQKKLDYDKFDKIEREHLLKSQMESDESYQKAEG